MILLEWNDIQQIAMNPQRTLASSSQNGGHEQKPLQEGSPSKSITNFKSAFFALIRSNQSPRKMQNFLIGSRAVLSEKVILHLYVAEPKLFAQFRYLLLALSLTLDRKQQYSQRWSTFYEIINQILKMPDKSRQKIMIESQVADFTLFLIDNVPQFFQEFPQTKKLLEQPGFKNNLQKNELENSLLVKRIVRIFNGLLCLKLVNADQFISIIYYFGLKSRNYVQFLLSIEDKFVKRLEQYEGQKKEQDGTIILEMEQLLILLHIFYDMDPDGKLRELIQTSLNESDKKLSGKTKMMIAHLGQIQSKKNNKNQSIHYDKLLKYILKHIINNKTIKVERKKEFVIECFNQIQQIDEQLFDYLLEAEGSQESSEVSDVLMKAVERESLRFITVSRIKSILKRINLSKSLSYGLNIKKMFRTLRLLYWLAKKFNESHPTYMLELNSSIRISNISKAMMVIFSIDFGEPQVGRVIQFEVNKIAYDILIKYSESEDQCAIEIITQVAGHQKLKEKKEISKWSFVLCMVGLCDKKAISIFIDGACFQIPLAQSAKQISSIQFGPFSGSIKDVYILDKVYQMHELHKGYYQKYRKMDQLLKQLGEKSYIFTFERGKVAEQSKWFWQKQMSATYNNVQKLRSISFGEGVEQLGGFPALLFLVTRVISSQKNDELVNFLIDFLQFLKLLINQGDARQAQKWMLSSTIYFGEFLWLILSRNQHLRNQKVLFNRIFDFFGHFFKTSSSQLTNNLRLTIIEDIYLNFQIWSKCSTQIKMMLFNEIMSKIDTKQSSILLEIFNRRDYEKIMSSLVFFFMEQNPNDNPETHFISGIKISLVHDQISKIGTKFCELYNHQKIQNNPEIIRRDLLLIMALINTFFQKEKLYFSQAQLSVIAVLLSHFSKNFTTLITLEKTLDHQIFIFDQLTNLISISPAQTEIIFLLFELSFILMTDLENIKNGTALVLDRFTLNGKRANDSLDFSFKVTLSIIKNSRILFQSTSIFSQEQVLSVLLGSLRNKAIKCKQRNEKKLRFEDVKRQFDKFALSKLSILFSLIEFCMVVKECVEEQDLFPVSVLLLKIIVNNDIFPDAQPLAMSCIKTISEYFKSKNINSHVFDNVMMLNSLSSSMNMLKKQQNEVVKKQTGNEKIEEGVLLQYRAMASLRGTFLSNQLQNLVKICRCADLMEIIITARCISPSDCKFNLPFSPAKWLGTAGSYGGALASILRCLPNLSTLQLQILLSYLTQISRSPQNSEEGSMKEVEERDILEKFLPLFIIHSSILTIAPDPQKLLNHQIQSIIVRAFEVIELNLILRYCFAAKVIKNNILAILKREQLTADTKSSQLINLSNKILEEVEKSRGSNLPIQNQLIELKKKFEVGSEQLQSYLANVKPLKKLTQQLKDIVESFQLFVQAFAKKPAKSSPQKLQMSISLLTRRRRTTQSSKKRKILEIGSLKQKQLYYEDLKIVLRNVCVKLQKQAKRKQEIWKNLYDQNKFWVSSKIKNNQCYEIHPKITGFYRLNIVKTAFEDVPYPRRKSFDHEIESSNTEQAQMEPKLPGSQLIKTLIPMEEPSDNVSRRVSGSILNNSTALKNELKAPKDSIFAQYITQRGVYAGILFYNASDQCFVFRCKGYASLPKDNIVYELSTIFHRIDDLQLKIAIQVNQKSEIYARRYIHRHTAIEIYSYQRSYFFNLFFKESRDRFLKSCSSRYSVISDPRAQFEKRKYTEKWINGQFDNFEYLMLVNLFAGRTANDLAQYPVMPWVITNYDEQQTQLNKQFLKDQKNVRDLSKPSGKLSQKKFQGLKMRCMEIGDQDYESKFLYGTMYSNPTVIYNFFIRLEPFTTLHWEHQGRRIDHADRLFSAVRDQFSTVLSSTSDNKELVPEFYYWPQFLKNRNKVNLGIKQNKEEVHDVKLPGWAKNPQQFIFKMREVLESAEVTRNINNWIDLIFGYKNPREVALQYDNLFHYRSYEHDIFQTEESEQAIKGAQISISEFGQIPLALFTKPHPRKQLVFTDQLKLDTSILIKKQGSKTISRVEMLSQGVFIAYDKEVQFYSQDMSKILDTTLQKPVRSYASEGSCVRVLDFSNSIWVTLKDGIFRIFQKKQCMIELDCQMECFSNFGRYIVYGFRSELVVMKIEPSYKLTRVGSFYGHKSNITTIEVSVMLDVVVSVDQGGLVLVHEFSKQKLMREFELGPGHEVTALCIHDMGYFIFFTKAQKLIIYTFLGELYLVQDIGVTNKAISEQITKISIFEQNRSLLLVATDKGKIYLTDFLQIKRFNENCVYKQFSRFKNNLLESCPRLGSLLGIRDYMVKKMPGKGVMTYKFYVLLENNSILCYYSSEQFQEKIKHNKMLGQLGLFDSSS